MAQTGETFHANDAIQNDVDKNTSESGLDISNRSTSTSVDNNVTLSHKDSVINELKGIYNRWESTYNRGHTWLTTGPPTIYTRTMLRLVLVFLVISILSIFTYASFYYIYVPRSTHQQTLYFQRTTVMKVGYLRLLPYFF